MALLHSMFNEIKEVSSTQEDYIKRLREKIMNFRTNARADFKAAENNIANIASRMYDALFTKIADMSMLAIRDIKDKETIKIYCKNETKVICDEITEALQMQISQEINNLNNNIRERKRHLDQELSSTKVSSELPPIHVSTSLDDALEKLDTSLGDIAGHVFTIIGVIIAVPLGPWAWIAAAFSIIKDFFGGRNRLAEAKEEIRKNIAKAKNATQGEFMTQINRIYQQLDDSCNDIVHSIETDIKNIDELLNRIDIVKQEIKLEYSKLNISDYGTM